MLLLLFVLPRQHPALHQALVCHRLAVLVLGAQQPAAHERRVQHPSQLHALRQQVMMLRANLSSSEEARTEAFAKLNGVFHGDEAQWMTRELLLIDEIGELEEV